MFCRVRRLNDLLKQKLFEAAEQHAAHMGYTATCLVESHNEHPLKSPSYIASDTFYQKLEYWKTSKTITFEWPTIREDGSIIKQEHHLSYWIKDLTGFQEKDEL